MDLWPLCTSTYMHTHEHPQSQDEVIHFPFAPSPSLLSTLLWLCRFILLCFVFCLFVCLFTGLYVPISNDIRLINCPCHWDPSTIGKTSIQLIIIQGNRDPFIIKDISNKGELIWSPWKLCNYVFMSAHWWSNQEQSRCWVSNYWVIAPLLCQHSI
jgi:hypothetical protein